MKRIILVFFVPILFGMNSLVFSQVDTVKIQFQLNKTQDVVLEVPCGEDTVSIKKDFKEKLNDDQLEAFKWAYKRGYKILLSNSGKKKAYLLRFENGMPVYIGNFSSNNNQKGKEQ